jgi:urease accessory protein
VASQCNRLGSPRRIQLLPKSIFALQPFQTFRPVVLRHRRNHKSRRCFLLTADTIKDRLFILSQKLEGTSLFSLNSTNVSAKTKFELRYGTEISKPQKAMNRISHFRSNGAVAIISFLGSLLIPSVAFAHHAEWMKDKPFIQGLSMPIHGLDHLLVTFAVGLIAVQIGGYALWSVPAAFSLLLLLGGVMNVSGIAVPFVEHAIFASIIVLGGLLVYRKKLPLLVGLVVVAFFAMFHGVALVGEGPHNAWFFVFAVGCLIAAWAVLGSGMAVGLLLKRLNQRRAIQYAGWVMIGAAALIALFPSLNDVIIHFLE